MSDRVNFFQIVNQWRCVSILRLRRSVTPTWWWVACLRSTNDTWLKSRTWFSIFWTSVKTFKIRHRPDKMLMLRIGIHSGPCAAGETNYSGQGSVRLGLMRRWPCLNCANFQQNISFVWSQIVRITRISYNIVKCSCDKKFIWLRFKRFDRTIIWFRFQGGGVMCKLCVFRGLQHVVYECVAQPPWFDRVGLRFFV